MSLTLFCEVKWAAVDEVDWEMTADGHAVLQRAEALWRMNNGSAAVLRMVEEVTAAQLNLFNLEDLESREALFGVGGYVGPDEIEGTEISIAAVSFKAGGVGANAIDLIPSIRASCRFRLPVTFSATQVRSESVQKAVRSLAPFASFMVAGVPLNAADSVRMSI